MEGSGRLLACCDVHHEEEERQLTQFQEGSGGQRGGSGQRGDSGQRGESGQSGDNGQSGESGGQSVDSGQRGDNDGQGVTVVREVTVVKKVTVVVREATVAVRKVIAVIRLLAAVVREVNMVLRVLIVVLEDVTEAAEVRCGSGGLLSPSLTTVTTLTVPPPLSQCLGGGHTPQPHPPAPTLRPKTCRYPGCQRSCYVERDGRVHDFCGRTHADRYWAEQTRSSTAAWSHHTEDEPQGVFWWMAGACVLCISTMLMY